MTHKVVLFVDSTKPIQVDYIKNQVQAIKKWKPELSVEYQNENSELLAKYSKTPGRLPAIMIFKNDVYKNYKHAKLSNDSLFAWLSASLG